MALTVENLCGLIIRSRLLPVEAAKGLYQRWQAEGRNVASLRAFAGWLVAKGHLTEYQVTLLSNGYADNFFLDHYKILSRIGKGRMAGVYRAVHALGQVVAIKVLPPSKAKEPRILARFQREARLAMQLNHPSVVRTYQMGECNGLHYLVMEYLEGETLETLLQERRKLPPREAVRIAFLSALGLQHINDRGMVHRDLKPGNLMICPAPGPSENTLRSMVKVLDIGLGRTLFDPKSKEAADDLTSEGSILGTPDYLAPEQARDARRADIRADIYSLGCSLYHALAGQPPFQDDNPVRQLLRHANEPPRPLKEMDSEIPAGLTGIVATMMAKDPAQRYQKPSQVADALKAFLATEAEVSKPTPPEMNPYLDWLNKPKPAPAQTAPAVVASPFPLPAKAKKLSSVAQPLPTAERIRKIRLRKTKLKRIVAAHLRKEGLLKAAATRGSALINVEPVTAQDLIKAPFGLRVNRDLFMLLAGACCVLGVVAAAWLVTHWFPNLLGDYTVSAPNPPPE
jgi:serine/threonine protein kinase